MKDLSDYGKKILKARKWCSFAPMKEKALQVCVGNDQFLLDVQVWLSRGNKTSASSVHFKLNQSNFILTLPLNLANVQHRHSIRQILTRCRFWQLWNLIGNHRIFLARFAKIKIAVPIRMVTRSKRLENKQLLISELVVVWITFQQMLLLLLEPLVVTNS